MNGSGEAIYNATQKFEQSLNTVSKEIERYGAVASPAAYKVLAERFNQVADYASRVEVEDNNQSRAPGLFSVSCFSSSCPSFRDMVILPLLREYRNFQRGAQTASNPSSEP